MASQTLVEQLLDLSDIEAQRRLLKEHAPLLDDEVASALKDRADHLLRADVTSALSVVNLLYLLAECTRDPTHRCLGLRAEGNIRCIALGEYRRAIELYDEAAQLYQDQGRLVDRAQSMVGKLWALANLGRYAEAFQVGEWASRVLEEHGEWRTLAVLTMNIGIVHSRAGDDAASLEWFNQAELLCHRLNGDGSNLEFWVQQNRAVALRTLGRFEEAVQAAKIAWEGLTRSGQSVAAARARQNLALTYFVLGRYNEALDHLDQVRDVFLADGRQRDAMRVELFVSDCLLQLRRFGEVLETCRRARSLFAELGTQDVVAQAIVNEAVAYAELGQYQQALASLAEARQIFEGAGNHARVAYADMESAALLLRQGRYKDCLALAETCATVFKDYDLTVEEVQAHLLASQAALALACHDQALRLVKDALRVAEARNIPHLKYQGHHLLGMLAAAQGDRQEALAAFDQAIEEVEQLRGRLMLEHRVSFLEDKAAIYEDIVALCLDLDQPLHGLEYAERAKSRALLDLLSFRLDLGIQARDRSDQALVEELTQLRTKRDQMYRRL
jgi:tetratricopeptide (TPR) repeat protein